MVEKKQLIEVEERLVAADARCGGNGWQESEERHEVERQRRLRERGRAR